ncbi:hypothetical protein [Marinobacter mangrovi]|uniref:hypothetical protein n=1 Tax=Marinobacter mangrovi TaxID=2803918 RepID=UPI001932E28F|nr:hypothetical protein [Marinobacter mangrovi]
MSDEKPEDGQIKAEFFTAAGVAAASGFTVSVGEKAYRYIKSKEPLVVQILDSSSIGDESRVVLQISNQTLHGIYIDEVAVPISENTQLKFYEWKKNFNHGGTGFPPIEWIEFDWNPTNIAPGHDFHFGISYVKPYDKNILFGEVEITYSRLDKKKSDKKSYVFRIR